MFQFRLNSHMWWQNVGDSGFPIVCNMYSVSVANNFFSPSNSKRLWTPVIWWVGSHTPTVFSGRLNKDLRCLLLSSGNIMCWQITQNFFQFRMKSLCLERGCWQLSRRLKVHIWRESSDGKLVDVLKNSLICFLHCSCSFQYRTGIELFCPAIIIGGDNHAPLHLLRFLLDGLLERMWIKGSEIGACRAE